MANLVMFFLNSTDLSELTSEKERLANLKRKPKDQELQSPIHVEDSLFKAILRNFLNSAEAINGLVIPQFAMEGVSSERSIQAIMEMAKENQMEVRILEMKPREMALELREDFGETSNELEKVFCVLKRLNVEGSLQEIVEKNLARKIESEESTGEKEVNSEYQTVQNKLLEMYRLEQSDRLPIEGSVADFNKFQTLYVSKMVQIKSNIKCCLVSNI